MNGAYVVSGESRLFERTAKALADDPALRIEAARDVVQLAVPSGRLLTVFRDEAEEWREALAAVGEGGGDDRFDSIWVECRWADLFCTIVGALPLRLDDRLLVVDGNAMVFDASRLDPEQLQL